MFYFNSLRLQKKKNKLIKYCADNRGQRRRVLSVHRLPYEISGKMFKKKKGNDPINELNSYFRGFPRELQNKID